MTEPTPDLAALQAQAAQAEAEAAEAAAKAAAAKAAAAKAALEAAQAAAPHQDDPAGETDGGSRKGSESAGPHAPHDDAQISTAEAAPKEQHDDAATPANGAQEGSGEPDETIPPAADPWVRTVREGYSHEGLTLELGALLVDGTPDPHTRIGLPMEMLNRHGLVAGATGTGKTRTLQLLAERLSAAGVPSFITDIKGDLTGLAQAGSASGALTERTEALGQDWAGESFPVALYRLGETGVGVPIRTTVTDFGPLLLTRVLGLNETQESALQLISHWADSEGLDLIDLKDLRAVVHYLTSERGKPELKAIGGISTATAGVILREISALEAQGGDQFFGEPAFKTSDLLTSGSEGGVISLLELPSVHDQPALFSTFVMWLLASLFEDLPEVGDVDKPRLVFFFDEAHLLFDRASDAFLAEVVKTVRLVRSKGVGVFFVTQTPKDVPADVLAQLGARVQHALRAFTPNDAKRLKQTVSTFPTSPYDLSEVLTSLGTGEAVITVLDKKGRPTPVAPTRLFAPAAVMGPASAGVAERIVASSPALATYGEAVDRESAYELLQAREEEETAAEARAEAEAAAAQAARKEAEAAEKERAKEFERMRKQAEKEAAAAKREQERAEARRGRIMEDMLRTAGRTITREITRTIFGTRRR